MDFSDTCGLVSEKTNTMGRGHKLQEGELYARAQIDWRHEN